jgi:polyphosphate glucokinase
MYPFGRSGANREPGARMRTVTRAPRTLALDIGGTHIKAAVLDARGAAVAGPIQTPTPRPALPGDVLNAIAWLAGAAPRFTRVAVGFPGVVRDGVAHTAVNLHPAWRGVNVAQRLSRRIGRPVRVANDADVQGMAVITGRGVELVLTLGTGVGSALFLDGQLIPNLELGHHPFRDNRTYEQLLGDHALKRIGVRAWRRRLGAAVAMMQKTFNPWRLYLGGGNARLVERPLPRGVRVVANVAGLLGGHRLWSPRRTMRRG